MYVPVPVPVPVPVCVPVPVFVPVHVCAQCQLASAYFFSCVTTQWWCAACAPCMCRLCPGNGGVLKRCRCVPVPESAVGDAVVLWTGKHVHVLALCNSAVLMSMPCSQCISDVSVCVCVLIREHHDTVVLWAGKDQPTISAPHQRLRRLHALLGDHHAGL